MNVEGAERRGQRIEDRGQRTEEDPGKGDPYIPPGSMVWRELVSQDVCVFTDTMTYWQSLIDMLAADWHIRLKLSV